jgi:serine/threonine protein phosphatase PrpC
MEVLSLGVDDGSVATVAIVDFQRKTVTVANAGDSEAVLFNWYEIYET